MPTFWDLFHDDPIDDVFNKMFTLATDPNTPLGSKREASTVNYREPHSLFDPETLLKQSQGLMTKDYFEDEGNLDYTSQFDPDHRSPRI